MKRRWRWILLLCLILMIPVSASANSPAPEPSVEFTLQLAHAPNEAYGITILTREPGAAQSAFMNDEHSVHREMIAAMFSLEAEGWYPVTEVPTGGLFQAKGTAQIEWMTISQSMKEYRIILITESGTIHVSDPVTHRDYANRATYDLETNQLTQRINYKDYGRRVLIAVLVTLIVETLVLKLFGFPVKQNLRVIVLTNLSTQLLLNVVLFVTHYYEFTQDNASVLLLMELVIPIIEAVAYAKFLQGRTVKRRVLYAFIANFTSFAIGMLIYDAYSAMLFLFFSPMIIVYWFNCLFDPAY
jgi:hypothetical protein